MFIETDFIHYRKKVLELFCFTKNFVYLCTVIQIKKRNKLNLIVMDAKIFVIEFPSLFDVMDELDEVFESILDKKEPCQKKQWFEKTNAPKNFPPMPEEPCCSGAPEWGIGGTPADENKRFGYGLEVDEPRCEDYDERWMFEDDHRAFDRFVEAGEDCVARGLDKRNCAPITKCGAIRKPVSCPPPMKDEVPGGELIGETHWWETTDW